MEVENEIQRSLKRKVGLKSVGYLIIDQTEAMTTIDINTGVFVGHRNLDETILNTNIEVTCAIDRQLRLRNLSSIIIIDFIDMLNEEHCRQVLHFLKRVLSKDRVKTGTNNFSQLGLVEIICNAPVKVLNMCCAATALPCHGNGIVKTIETICYRNHTGSHARTLCL